MRKMFGFFAAMAITLAGTVIAQDKRIEVSGSGNVVTRDIPVKSFSKLTVGGAFNLVLAQGDKEDVRVEAEDNLQDLILVNESENGLTVSMKKNVNIRKSKKMTVYVTFKQLEAIELKTVGKVITAGTLNFDELKMRNQSVGNVDMHLTARTLTLDNQSVGNLEISGKADNAVISNKSVGNLDASGFVVQSMDVENTGIGNVQVNAAKILKLNSSGIGKVKNKGGGNVTKVKKVEI